MDAEAFEVYMRHALPRVRAQVTGRVPPDETDDVVQTTFMSLWTTTQKPDYQDLDYEHLDRLVHRIASKRVADLWRGRYRNQERIGAVEALRHDAAPSASDEVIACVPPAWLNKLSDDELHLLLQLAEKTPVSEIAGELGISPNAASSRIRRLRSKVPMLLERELASDRD